jgi:hypothetical protein
MYEQLTHILTQALAHMAGVFLNKLLPQVGVGGSVETLESVPWNYVMYGLVVLAALLVSFLVSRWRSLPRDLS